MKDFIQMLEDAFPMLRNHPRWVLGIFVLFVLFVAAYKAKNLRAKICRPLCAKLSDQIAVTTRWVHVYRDSIVVNDWKYYTSETTGKGREGDDIIWTLVHWPSLKPKDSFKVQGAVGMVEGIHDSRAKLRKRWHIIHDPDSCGIGPVPALGIRSRLRRICAKLLTLVG
jgi:hypothetical protein